MRIFLVNNVAESVLLDSSIELLSTRRSLAVLVAIAFLAGFTGPFGTATSYDIWTRLIYWALIVFATVLPVHLVLAVFDRFAVPRGFRHIAWTSLACLSASVPATIVVYMVSLTFGSKIELTAVGEIYLQCFLVILAITTIAQLVSGASPAKRPDHGSDLLMNRLPGACRGTLIRMTAQDHYVEVVTDHGRALVAMRLRDAIAEAAPIAGSQVHRSHWVARDAVIGRLTVDHATRLRLKDGSTVPVGRTFRDAAKRAGVLY
ncbi:hypothetical protein PhaeoP78_00268 [Phaeobacter inhibens]|nr:hypothetical protein PhaeoP78_00268 [Phaeobacter inhibens]